MSNAGTAVAEDQGAGPYVKGWQDESSTELEVLLATLSAKRDRLAQSAEANGRHEVGGAQDVIGALSAAVEAIAAAGERVMQHSDALKDAHEGALERTRGSNVQSQQEYAGKS